MTAPQPKRRAETYDEIKPLVELIKAGRLFEVQAWIAAGRPLDAPPPPPKGARKKNPLETAIETGFHSIVQVLLDGGATIEPAGYGGPMSRVLELRRLDLAMLLVDHGFDPRTVDMVEVFHTWDPAIMEYFIERARCRDRVSAGRGAAKSHPVGAGNFQAVPGSLPEFPEAGRHRAALSLPGRQHEMGVADALGRGRPVCEGPHFLRRRSRLERMRGCLRWAGLLSTGTTKCLHMKRIRLDPANPATWEVASYVRGREGVDILADLLKRRPESKRPGQRRQLAALRAPDAHGLGGAARELAAREVEFLRARG